MGAAERRQLILDLLCQRRKETIPNLAAELGVSERTIRRDIEMLTLRYPIETACGRYGGGVRPPAADAEANGPAAALGRGTPGRGPGRHETDSGSVCFLKEPQWAPLLFEKFTSAVRITTRTGAQCPP